MVNAICFFPISRQLHPRDKTGLGMAHELQDEVDGVRPGPGPRRPSRRRVEEKGERFVTSLSRNVLTLRYPMEAGRAGPPSEERRRQGPTADRSRNSARVAGAGT